MSLKIASPVDFNGFASSNFVIGSTGANATGAVYFDASGSSDAALALNASASALNGCPLWRDSVGVWHAIPPVYDYLSDSSSSGVVLADFGTVRAEFFEGQLTGLADTAVNLFSAVQVSVTGKATAAATNLQGALTPTVSLNVTALSIVPGDIALSDGTFLVGNVSNVAAQVAKSSIPISGFGAATAEVNFGGKVLNNVGTPVTGTDGANKDYVDNLFSGTSTPSDPARVATTTALPAYTPSGSPAALTADANGLLQIDGVNLNDGDSILVKDESGANEKYNGIYAVTDAGSNDPGGSPFILTRRDDANTSVEVNTGDTYFVQEGTSNGGTTWSLQTAPPITLGTTALHFVQVDGNSSYQAGKGLVPAGNVFHFAQSTDYPQFGVPYAADVDEIAFASAGANGTVLRVPSAGGAPAFGAVDLDMAAAVTGTLGVANGGTNIASYTTGDILYASGGTTLSKLAAAASGNVLLSGTTPSWGKVGLTTHVSGTLPVANGGTERVAFTVNGVVLGNGTSALGVTAAGTIAQFLQVAETNVPRFVTMSGDATIADGGALTIGSKKVSYGKIQDTSASSVVIGRSTAGPGSVEEITFANLAAALMATGNINPSTALTGDVTGTGTGSIETTIAGLKFFKLENGSALSVLGVSGNSTAAVASIAAGGSSANKTLRVSSNGLTIGWGALNIASSNAVTGVLPTTNGGTGTSASLIFPTLSGGQVALIKTFNLPSGSSQYIIAHGMGTSMLAPTVKDSTGAVILVDIVIDSTNATVTFGEATAASHTLMLVGSNVVT